MQPGYEYIDDLTGRRVIVQPSETTNATSSGNPTLDSLADLRAQLAAKERVIEQLVEAHDLMRDAVLHERHQMAEMDFGSERVNAVLGVIDDTFAAALAAAQVQRTSEGGEK